MKFNIWILGIDGSGKTTLAKEMIKKFNQKNIDSAYYHLEGPPILKYIPFYSRIRKKLVLSQQKSEKTMYKMILWLGITTMDNIIDRLLKTNVDGILIQDRIFYQDFIEYFNLTPEWLLKLYMRTLREPDLIFFINIRPEIARKRKMEQDTEFLKNQEKNLKIALKVLENKKIVGLNGNESVEKISSKMMKEVMVRIKNDR